MGSSPELNSRLQRFVCVTIGSKVKIYATPDLTRFPRLDPISDFDFQMTRFPISRRQATRIPPRQLAPRDGEDVLS